MEKFSLSGGAYDLDFNLVNTPHKIIYLDEKRGDIRHPISIRADEFKQNGYKEKLGKKYRFRNDDRKQAYREQSDRGVHGEYALLDDLRKNDQGPSRQKFLESVRQADPASISTLRESSQSAIQKSLYMWLSDILTPDEKKLMEELAIYKYTRAKKGEDLLKQYTQHINCYAVNNKDVSNFFGFEGQGKGIPGEKKATTIIHDIYRFDRNEIGIREELWKNMHLPKEYGFSDDKYENIAYVANAIMNEKVKGLLKDRKFTLFHTHKDHPSKISIRNHEA